MIDLLELANRVDDARSPEYDRLVQGITELMNNNFEQLVHSLYKIDVSELKLRDTLKEYPEKEAAVLITQLIIERQAAKRSTFLNGPPMNVPDVDRW